MQNTHHFELPGIQIPRIPRRHDSYGTLHKCVYPSNNDDVVKFYSLVIHTFMHKMIMVSQEQFCIANQSQLQQSTRQSTFTKAEYPSLSIVKLNYQNLKHAMAVSLTNWASNLKIMEVTKQAPKCRDNTTWRSKCAEVFLEIGVTRFWRKGAFEFRTIC